MTDTLIHGAWLAGGVALALAFLRFAAAFGPRAERWVLALGLVVVAAVYPVLAATGGAQEWLWPEIVVGAGFLAIAVMGLVRSPLWLSGGWVLHAAWDSPFHLASSATAFVPVGYILLCASFDLVVAAAVYLRYRRGMPAGAARDGADAPAGRDEPTLSGPR